MILSATIIKNDVSLKLQLSKDLSCMRFVIVKENDLEACLGIICENVLLFVMPKLVNWHDIILKIFVTIPINRLYQYIIKDCIIYISTSLQPFLVLDIFILWLMYL